MLSISALYLLTVAVGCQPSAPVAPPPPEPPPVGVVSDVAAARAEVAEGKALAIVSGPLGMVAVGRGKPGMLGKPAESPAALSTWLADKDPPTRLLLLDPSWEPDSADALCGTARTRAGSDIPCERGPADLMDDPEAPLIAEVLGRQVHAQGELTPEQRDAATAVAAAGQPALVGCYAAAREERPGVAGRLVLEVAVGPEGEVTATAVDRGWGQESFELCIQEIAKGWRFPMAADKTLLAFPVMFGLTP